MNKEWMLKNVWAYIGNGDISCEKQQCIDEGKDITSVDKLFDEYEKIDVFSKEAQDTLRNFLDITANLPQLANCDLVEPSDYKGITEISEGAEDMPMPSQQVLEDKVLGAWLGRIAGCTFGKPFEGRRRWQVIKYLKETNNYPPTHYIAYKNAPKELIEECGIPTFTKDICDENMCKAITDDDLNYPVVALVAYRDYGKDFTSEDVATTWLAHLPFSAVCTAEKIAYLNFVKMIAPPESGAYQNPYREWIGAQIRADFWGWVNPCKPTLAAEYAYRDASISHIKNGIYGEMWVAAMLAAAFATNNIKEIIKTGLSQIPTKSRLYKSITHIIGLYESGISFDELMDNIHSRWNENEGHGWCHTISNAEIVAASLLWGESDYSKTIEYSVLPGFDTDCNGATAGSILGVILGAKALPESWTKPINDTLETAIAGYNNVSVSEMSKITLDFIKNA